MGKRIIVRFPDIEEVTFELFAEQDDTPVRGNLVVSDNEELDRQEEDRVIQRLDDGDVWAWASVEVRATWKGLSASEFLGGCSYESEEEFKELSGGYYEEMKQQAYEMLLHEIECLEDNS